MTITVLKTFLGLAVIVSGYAFLIRTSQRNILKFLRNADFQIQENRGIFQIVDKNSNPQKLKDIIKEFKGLKKDNAIKAINNTLNTTFNILLEEGFLDNRLEFVSQKREAVELELEQIKNLILKIDIDTKEKETTKEIKLSGKK